MTLDYEFLDDMYSVMEWNQTDSGQKIINEKRMERGAFHPRSLFWKAFNIKDVLVPVVPHKDFADFADFGKSSEFEISYSLDSSVLRYNHPLHIMVSRFLLLTFE